VISDVYCGGCICRNNVDLTVGLPRHRQSVLARTRHREVVGGGSLVEIQHASPVLVSHREHLVRRGVEVKRADWGGEVQLELWQS